MTRRAQCRCGQLAITVEGEPLRVHEDRRHVWVGLPDEIEHYR